MRIGFWGIQCGSSNKGVAALAYSALSIFNNIIKEQAEFVLFTIDSKKSIDLMKSEVSILNKEIEIAKYNNKNLSSIRKVYKNIKSCDLIIDFTGGDSFADIYGTRRLISGLINKQMVISSKTPLILAPQTYGPYNNKITKIWVKYIINHSKYIFSRDEKSKNIIKKMTKAPIYISTDVAFYLPWNPQMYSLPKNEKIKIGINISGLLWNGGYTSNNQFHLKTNYKKICTQIISRLLKTNKYEIHLISHVISENEKSCENDVTVAKDLKSMFRECVLSPVFQTPIQAKSYISNMEIFIGARMHATIAAFSTGVPTIPLSYSKKFEGLYENLNYHIMIDLKKENTEEAINKTLQYIEDKELLKEMVKKSNGIANEKLNCFIEKMTELINENDMNAW